MSLGVIAHTLLETLLCLCPLWTYLQFLTSLSLIQHSAFVQRHDVSNFWPHDMIPIAIFWRYRVRFGGMIALKIRGWS